MKKAEKIGDKLYAKYGKPLEDEHWGEFIAISEDGKIALSASLIDVFKKSESFTTQSHIFKVGEKAVYKWLRIKA
ncbi:hypothetical protein HYZ05_00795 [Candidatus Daviesbacteria bacterium]|nr:hypothetical protein [Candidatus Daviesbacteria bacterium]